jgi:hypothetical protein
VIHRGLLTVLLGLLPPLAAYSSAAEPALVILTETGQHRDGLPVLDHHPAPDRHLALLTRGFSGRLLRLYPIVQRMANPGRPPEPAYLLLSNTQGGFPRFGFHLGQVRHESTAYVDLHRDSTLSGRHGAVDQIFPHELLHVFVHHLAGDPPAGGANQVHAIGVRTDRITAFGEGFAEHGQLMAIDAEDAAPETQALAHEAEAMAAAMDHIAAYRRALSARWSLAPRAQLTFPLWFSRTEQVLRYHGVKANLFAREPDLGDRAVAGRATYRAYLLENVLPGRADAQARPTARLLATEGAVSALFYRLIAALAAGGRAAPPAGAGASLDALDHAYLKVFSAIADGGHDTARVVDAYRRLFPDDRAIVDEVVAGTFGATSLSAPREIWLRSGSFRTGTTVFDQFRALPRAHTFDLNACSRVDLAGVPGMTPATASQVMGMLPVDSIDELAAKGVDASVVEALRHMRDSFEQQRASDLEEDASLSIRDILMPYVWRALAAIAGGAVAASLLYRALRRIRLWRVLLNGLAASTLGLAIGWSVDPGTGALAFGVPTVLFGLPAALWQLVGRGSRAEATRALVAWACAALVPALMVRPIG